jgi:hypothetical protein
MSLFELWSMPAKMAAALRRTTAHLKFMDVSEALSFEPK